MRGLTLCGRDSDTRSCAGTLFSTLGISYSRVCGQLRGYQRFTPDGFHLYNNNGNIDGANYVDGVSITYGNSPRNHIWTYACGLYLDGDRRAICPCNTNGLTSNAAFPSFIGNDYYCETVIMTILVVAAQIYLVPHSLPMTHYGMANSVLTRKLPAAVLTPIYHGLQKHLVIPPQKTLKLEFVEINAVVMKEHLLM